MTEPDGAPADEPRERALRALRVLYADLDRELGALRPKCELSGRCCDFRRSGLELFATDLELDHLLRTAPPAGAADDPALCPWWREGLCEAREGRPLGCRLYFCDESKAAPLEELSIRYHARLRALHAANVPYHYSRFVGRVRERLARVAISPRAPAPR